ncbi:MAG: YciC family protein [Verrucomicrobiales bacterium]
MKEWYFADNGERRGPVSGQQLAQLRAAGTLAGDTLVWTEGMDDWVPMTDVDLGNLPPIGLPSALESAPEHEIGTCAVSGRRMLKKDMLSYGESWIAPDRKDEFLQRLRENAGIGEDDGLTDINDAIGSLQFGYIMKRSFRLFTRNFSLLAALYFTIWIPCNFLMEFIDYEILVTDDLARSFRLQRFFDGFIGIIAFGAVTHLLLCRTNGKATGYGNSLGEGFSHWGKLWVANFLTGICIVVSFIALIVPGLIVIVRLALAPTVVMTEGCSGTDAISRSWELTKGKYWPLAGYSLLLVLLIFGVAVGLGIPMAFVPELGNWFVAGMIDCIVGIVELYSFVLFYTLYDELICIED